MVRRLGEYLSPMLSHKESSYDLDDCIICTDKVITPDGVFDREQCNITFVTLENRETNKTYSDIEAIKERNRQLSIHTFVQEIACTEEELPLWEGTKAEFIVTKLAIVIAYLQPIIKDEKERNKVIFSHFNKLLKYSPKDYVYIPLDATNGIVYTHDWCFTTITD